MIKIKKNYYKKNKIICLGKKAINPIGIGDKHEEFEIK